MGSAYTDSTLDPARVSCWCGAPADRLDPVDPAVTPGVAVVWDGDPYATRCYEHTTGGYPLEDVALVPLAPGDPAPWWEPSFRAVEHNPAADNAVACPACAALDAARLPRWHS